MEVLEKNKESSSTTDQGEARRKKRDLWVSEGLLAYPTADGYQPKDLAVDIHAKFDSFSKEDLEEKAKSEEPAQVSVAGRVMLHRSFGKSTFLTLHDRSGKIQIFTQKSKLPENIYNMVKSLDLGDLVFAEGPVFKTRTGELTIDATRFRLMSKSLKPLPEKFHGLQDVEQRYRQRYLDLICNQEVKETFRKRAAIIQEIREFFNERDYLEVETPMLHPLVSGASAKPFKTFHNTLKMDLFLRIAPELYLKRLVVGGFDRVFEINRSFRNEGISVKHNPEFTMLEFYEAFATYHDLMNMTESLIEHLAKKVCGSTEIEYQGQKISLKSPFARMTVIDAIQEFTALNVEKAEELSAALKNKGIELLGKESVTELQWLCFEEFVEEKLVQPTFVTDHPVQVSPLARRSESNPEVTERFELYIGSREIANGFNELNDPDDQESRFRDQLKRKEMGDEEACDFDEDYIQALQVGLPPTAGEGIGIDRLTMLLTDSASIRDVILFPQMKSTIRENVTSE